MFYRFKILQTLCNSEPTPSNSEFDKPWRPTQWDMKVEAEMELRNLQLTNPDVGRLRILLHGPIGAGKSSFINSVDNVFKGRVTGRALAAATTSGTSFTKTYNAYNIGELYTFNDIVGLEPGSSAGAQPDDIINALKGHVKEGYRFNPLSPLAKDSPDYIKTPSLSDRVHCLVSVVAADTISLMATEVITKMRYIREKASDMGIPQVVLLTKVDDACPLVKEDLKKVYKSKLIKQKMEECRNELGVPMNCILPVKNYYEQIHLDPTMDMLLLEAMTIIGHFANDYAGSLS